MLFSGPVTFAVLAVQCIGLLFFAKGFFPYKPIFHGHAPFQNNNPPAVFDRLVFIVVDALRSDFVYSDDSPMAFTQSLISSRNALPFTAHAAPPTVTLPRIKGLTTGSVANFLDAVLNIAESDESSSLQNFDNWLVQFKRRKQGGKLIMFGDDTWLKLFPGLFDRSDGTSSFFVSDFTEVDNNVTRHIDGEIRAPDWDVMILHYLGVDHIGHKGGPNSPFMAGKLLEMDKIVKNIYQSLENKAESTLVVLCGDHGMNEAGNHGGSSAGETSTALLLLSPKFSEILPESHDDVLQAGEYSYHAVIEQSDIVPSISGLFANPIPMNNIGVVFPQILKFWPADEQKRLLHDNANQMFRILQESFPDFKKPVVNLSKLLTGNDVDQLRGLWVLIHEPYDDNETHLDNLFKFLRLGQKVLSRTSSNYDLSSMVLGILLVLTASAVSLQRIMFISESGSKICKLAFLIGTTLHSVSLFGSSLIEEEHYFWYWCATAWFAIQLSIGTSQKSKQSIKTWGGLVVISAILRHYNHTGQKYAGSYDVAKFLSDDQSTVILWILVVAVHVIVFKNLMFYVFSNASPVIQFVCSFTPVISIFSFKVATAIDTGDAVPYLIANYTPGLGSSNLVQRARTAFLAIAICLLFHAVSTFWNTKPEPWKFIRGFFYLLELFLIAQTCPSNIPIFLLFAAIFSVTRRYVTHGNGSLISIAVTTLIWQHFSFFALGNSNSLASIDLSNAYNGISEYSIIPVGILTFASNWIGPIYFSAMALVLVSIRATKNLPPAGQVTIRHGFINTYLPIIYAYHSLSLLTILVSCFVLRSHLFIWTVFSPKLLYAAAWFVCQQIVVDTGLGVAIIMISDWI
ncbi:alkaline-phosphatase-like protein [Lipomyces japonicus]|uniref:alkaline-phosphatase-like protein n=1 Tax=Lipomyces japonicus TaxID=56871 RepID=UPI0034CE7320